jgi:hypothetical protein
LHILCCNCMDRFLGHLCKLMLQHCLLADGVLCTVHISVHEG